MCNSKIYAFFKKFIGSQINDETKISFDIYKYIINQSSFLLMI